MIQIRVHSPIAREVYMAQYLATNIKDVQFVEERYTATPVPNPLTKLYRLLLELIWMKGIMTTNFATRVSYDRRSLYLSFSTGYVEINNRSFRHPVAIQIKILKIIGEAPGWIYA